jgi:hypothetical protein
LTAEQWGNGKTDFVPNQIYSVRIAGVNSYNMIGVEAFAPQITTFARRMLGASNSSSVRELSTVRLPPA